MVAVFNGGVNLNQRLFLGPVAKQLGMLSPGVAVAPAVENSPSTEHHGLVSGIP